MSVVSNIVSLLTNTKANLSDGSDEVILGPVSEESENWTADVPTQAVEDGSEMTDHVHQNPGSFSVNTVFSDSSDLVSAAISLISGGDSMSVKDKVDKLKTWQKEGTLLTYSGPVFSSFLSPGYDMVVEDVVISGLSLRRSNDSGSALVVAISLSEIQIANAEETNIDLASALKSTTSKGTTANGTTSASTTTSGGSSSILAKMLL